MICIYVYLFEVWNMFKAEFFRQNLYVTGMPNNISDVCIHLKWWLETLLKRMKLKKFKRLLHTVFICIYAIDDNLQGNINYYLFVENTHFKKVVYLDKTNKKIENMPLLIANWFKEMNHFLKKYFTKQ